MLIKGVRMRFVFYTSIISPHQLPLARELIKQLGVENYRYVYLYEVDNERINLGWGDKKDRKWCVSATSMKGRECLESAQFLLSAIRDVDLMKRRSLRGLRTAYTSERWFKPPAGILRLFFPSYLCTAWRFVRLVKSGFVICLPIGVWAARDMARLFGLFSGDWRCLFRAPRVKFDSEPMGEVSDYPWMRMWGYFVEPSVAKSIPAQETDEPITRVLWVGRLLRLKRVDTLFKAIYVANERHPTTLTIVGTGDEVSHLKRLDDKLARKYRVSSLVSWHAPVPIGEVRVLMRSHNVYVLSSNGHEGWGAVVSEALEENMEVFGTYEAGSSATILPRENLFYAGDWRMLGKLLIRFGSLRKHYCHGVGKWNAKVAAERLIAYMERKKRL